MMKHDLSKNVIHKIAGLSFVILRLNEATISVQMINVTLACKLHPS